MSSGGLWMFVFFFSSSIHSSFISAPQPTWTCLNDVKKSPSKPAQFCSVRKQLCSLFSNNGDYSKYQSDPSRKFAALSSNASLLCILKQPHSHTFFGKSVMNGTPTAVDIILHHFHVLFRSVTFFADLALDGRCKALSGAQKFTDLSYTLFASEQIISQHHGPR